MDPFTFPVGDTAALVTLLAKATLLLVLAFGAATALQRATAGARHLVWAATLGAVLILPAIVAWSPLRLAVLPAALLGTSSAERAGSPLLLKCPCWNRALAARSPRPTARPPWC